MLDRRTGRAVLKAVGTIGVEATDPIANGLQTNTADAPASEKTSELFLFCREPEDRRQVRPAERQSVRPRPARASPD